MKKIAFQGILCAIAFATSFSTNHSSAEDDFSALLSDLRFKNQLPQGPLARVADASQAPAILSAPNAGDALTLPADAAVTSAPVGQGAAMESIPAPPPQAVQHTGPADYQGEIQHNQFVDPSSVEACSDGCSTCDSGCGSCDSGNCQPYTPPRIPSSTLYQYWRSNACNVNVWYGYRNECHGANRHTMGNCDCFKPKKGLCAKFGQPSACQIVEPLDCGPPPAQWCDSCDSH